MIGLGAEARRHHRFAVLQHQHSLTGKLGVRSLTLALLVVTVLLALADWGSQVAGDTTIPGGPLDELAHLLTTLLVLGAIGGLRCARFTVAALVASVAIDLDHVPALLGSRWLTAGTPRPYTHSLLTLAVVLAATVVIARQRVLVAGALVGLTSHFWRDLGEPGSGVSILWPFSYRPESVPHVVYLLTIVLLLGACVARLVRFGRLQSRREGCQTLGGVPWCEARRGRAD